MNLLDRLHTELTRPDNVRAVIAQVSSVGPGRVVDLDVLGGSVVGIPVGDAYPSPASGDVVLVLKTGSAWLVVCSIGKTTVPGGPNLLSNPSFEFGAVGAQPSDWSNFWTSGTVSPFVIATDAKRSGDYAAKAGLSGANESVTIQPSVGATPITPGVQYRVGYWYRVSSAMPTDSSLNVDLLWSPDPDPNYFGATTTVAAVGVTVATVANSWRYVETLWTAPGGAAFVRPTFAARTVATSWTGSVWLDDVSFRTAT